MFVEKRDLSWQAIGSIFLSSDGVRRTIRRQWPNIDSRLMAVSLSEFFLLFFIRGSRFSSLIDEIDPLAQFLGKVTRTRDNGIASLLRSTSVNNNVRTVSDTKRTFYSMHSRPINSIYRRFVEELMVEMHLLSVNVDFRYDPIYALGVVTSYDRFMVGYRPEKDLTSIFNAICQAVEEDPQKYHQDAQKLAEFAKSLSSETLLAWLSKESSPADVGEFQEVLDAIASNSKFKYSRIFAIGLFTLLEIVDPEMVKDEKQRTAALEKLSAALNLPGEKISKDLELYSSNLDKMTQARQVMEDILAADRKKREKREKEKTTVTNSPSDTEESTTESTTD